MGCQGLPELCFRRKAPHDFLDRLIQFRFVDGHLFLLGFFPQEGEANQVFHGILEKSDVFFLQLLRGPLAALRDLADRIENLLLGDGLALDPDDYRIVWRFFRRLLDGCRTGRIRKRRQQRHEGGHNKKDENGVRSNHVVWSPCKGEGLDKLTLRAAGVSRSSYTLLPIAPGRPDTKTFGVQPLGCEGLLVAGALAGLIHLGD